MRYGNYTSVLCHDTSEHLVPQYLLLDMLQENLIASSYDDKDLGRMIERNHQNKVTVIVEEEQSHKVGTGMIDTIKGVLLVE